MLGLLSYLGVEYQIAIFYLYKYREYKLIIYSYQNEILSYFFEYKNKNSYGGRRN